MRKHGGAFEMRGKWEIQAQKLKDKFNELTDADLEFVEGKEKELLRRLEKRLNKKREEVIELIKIIQHEQILSMHSVTYKNEI